MLILVGLSFTSWSQNFALFNGKDLSGWKIHGTEKWYVEKGELICESGPDKEYGYLATDKNYKDFDLTVEFKLVSNGNSGVFFRSSLEGTKITGWQAEVAPPGHHTALGRMRYALINLRKKMMKNHIAYDKNFYPKRSDQVPIPRDFGDGDEGDQ